MITLLNKYKDFIFIALIILVTGIFFTQHQQLINTKAQLEITKQISNQNMAALKDNSIQLEVTKSQLGLVDSTLKDALIKVDSIGKIKTKVITVAKPIYVNKVITVPSSLDLDTPNNVYGLTFTDTDMVRTISGVSYFKINKKDTNNFIIPDSTKINDFKLNFTFVISQYTDNVNKFTRTKIIPFNIKKDGTLGDTIPSSLLQVQFRNAEILDKPFTPQTSTTNNKRTLKGGWGVTFNPIAIGMYPANSSFKFGWTPNVGVGYYLTFK